VYGPGNRNDRVNSDIGAIAPIGCAHRDSNSKEGDMLVECLSLLACHEVNPTLFSALRAHHATGLRG